MSETLKQIRILARKGEIKVSEHGYDELANDGLFVRDLVKGLPHAEVVEDYPDFHKGPCVLLLEHDHDGNPVHAVWGIPKNATTPAVLVTAYRPDPDRWSNDFRSRVK